jgi:hypothetical protein
MHSSILHKPKPIRFRRWSRTGYAVFCSLACSVTVGCLAISISDKSLQKLNKTSSNAYSPVGTDSDSSEKIKAESELDVALQQIQETTLTQMTFDSTVACGQATLYFFIHHIG